jgi:hypothetical protein
MDVLLWLLLLVVLGSTKPRRGPDQEITVLPWALTHRLPRVQNIPWPSPQGVAPTIVQRSHQVKQLPHLRRLNP